MCEPMKPAPPVTSTLIGAHHGELASISCTSVGRDDLHRRATFRAREPRSVERRAGRGDEPRAERQPDPLDLGFREPREVGEHDRGERRTTRPDRRLRSRSRRRPRRRARRRWRAPRGWRCPSSQVRANAGQTLQYSRLGRRQPVEPPETRHREPGGDGDGGICRKQEGAPGVSKPPPPGARGRAARAHTTGTIPGRPGCHRPAPTGPSALPSRPVASTSSATAQAPTPMNTASPNDQNTAMGARTEKGAATRARASPADLAYRHQHRRSRWQRRRHARAPRPTRHLRAPPRPMPQSTSTRPGGCERTWVTAMGRSPPRTRGRNATGASPTNVTAREIVDGG